MDPFIHALWDHQREITWVFIVVLEKKKIPVSNKILRKKKSYLKRPFFSSKDGLVKPVRRIDADKWRHL
jgi:hypothetical protein